MTENKMFCFQCQETAKKLMSYFNVFFQAAICHSWFPAAKLRLKKRSYGNNCDRRILKKHKKSVGERIFFYLFLD